MVVVVLTAGGALLLLKAYNNLPETLSPATVIEQVQQGTAVLAALCAATFAVIAALKQWKPPLGGISSSSASLPATHAAPLSGRSAVPSGAVS